MILTDRQIEVLRFIEKYQKENGWSPAIREIAYAIGVESTATVHTHLKNLEKKGYIQRMTGAPRTIKILKTYDVITEMLLLIAEGMQDGESESICGCECPV